MRYRYYETNSTRKILTYFLYIVLLFWIFTSLILGYQFLVKTSSTTTTKGGTFVEAIFNDVSYLPYLKNDGQSLFYQSFLFDACIHYDTLNKKGLEAAENCSIQSSDYQNYYITLPESKQKTWSDGKAWSLEDLLFTYATIIKQNTWNIRALNAYQEIQVSQEENKIKVVFPTSTTDNNYFFTSYILPKHVLEHADLEMYRTIFAATPITSACGKIAPKTKDTQSLVFDLTKCTDTNLGYYQIKNYDEFETFSKSVIEEKNQLIDAYAGNVALDGYQRKNIIKSQLLTLFFNTKSEKLKVRMRRVLGGLFNAKLYADEYHNYLKKYDGSLLTLFHSDGSNVKEFISRLGKPDETEGVQQEDLRDSGITELKKSILINGVERKFVFFTPRPANNIFNLEIKFSNQFESIKITDNNKNTFTPKNYKKTDKKVIYPLEIGKNLKDSLNQYTIQGSIKGKTYTIANIDLYLLPSQATTTPDDAAATKIKVVYYNNLESNFAIKKIREILSNAEVLESFLFEQVSSPEELEAKLVVGDYDILLNTINIGMKKDILKILMTEDPLINPSKYTNPQLTALFRQHTRNPQSQELRKEINEIFAQDMPFIILGYPYDFINIKESLITTGTLEKDVELYEYDWRNHLYHNITLVQNTVIDFSKIKDIKGFIKEIAEVTQPPKHLFPSSQITQEERTAENALETEQAKGNENLQAPTTENKNESTSETTIQKTSDPFADLVKPAE